MRGVSRCSRCRYWRVNSVGSRPARNSPHGYTAGHSSSGAVIHFGAPRLVRTGTPSSGSRPGSWRSERSRSGGCLRRLPGPRAALGLPGPPLAPAPLASPGSSTVGLASAGASASAFAGSTLAGAGPGCRAAPRRRRGASAASRSGPRPWRRPGPRGPPGPWRSSPCRSGRSRSLRRGSGTGPSPRADPGGHLVLGHLSVPPRGTRTVRIAMISLSAASPGYKGNRPLTRANADDRHSSKSG